MDSVDFIYKLASIFVKAVDKDYKKQIYSDSNGEYKVPDIINWAKENAPLKNFNIDKLAEIAFQPSSEEDYDEVPGSSEFVARAMKSDLSYPIVVVRYSDGDFIADGNHRLWKARELGHKTIKGYLMHEDDLKNLRVVKNAALRIVADSFMLTRLITDDIKKKYKIPVDAKPFPRGGFNSVFINSDDNVVAFVDTPHACGAAYKAVGRNLASVPEVYDLDEIEVLKNRDRDFNDTEKDVPALNWERNKLKICVIVMERLGELDANEEKLFDELYASLWSHDPKYKQIEKNIRNIFPEFASDFDDLIYTMKKENIDHKDFYASNIGRSKDGRLKLIDWESIRIYDKRHE
jgi:hypothetical protein